MARPEPSAVGPRGAEAVACEVQAREDGAGIEPLYAGDVRGRILRRHVVVQEHGLHVRPGCELADRFHGQILEPQVLEQRLARLTEGYDLPARWVIHAVGPIYRDGRHGEPALLAACYRNALSLALTHEVRTIAFPAISCGVYGYPVAEAATIAVREVAGFLEHDTTFEQIVFCCFSVDVELAYLEAMEEIESP